MGDSSRSELERLIYGSGYDPGDAFGVQELLSRCTERELKLAEDVLKLFLMKQ